MTGQVVIAEQDETNQRDDMNVPVIATVGTVSVALTIAIVFAVQALYIRYANAETQRKVISAPNVTSDSKLAEQDAQLTRYSWINRDEGAVTIPIERAMRLVVKEVRSRQSATISKMSPATGKDK